MSLRGSVPPPSRGAPRAGGGAAGAGGGRGRVGGPARAVGDREGGRPRRTAARRRSRGGAALSADAAVSSASVAFPRSQARPRPLVLRARRRRCAPFVWRRGGGETSFVSSSFSRQTRILTCQLPTFVRATAKRVVLFAIVIFFSFVTYGKERARALPAIR